MDTDPTATDAPADATATATATPLDATATPPVPPMDGRRKLVLLLVVAISLWHLGSITIWMSPSSIVRDRLVRITRKYVRITKSDQNWAMFAPEPLSVNRRAIVRAELDSGEMREADLTSPANRAMRSLTSFARVGKILKAHDRILASDEPGYTRGFALYTCKQLSDLWGTHVRSITLIREYSVMNIDGRTLRATRTNPERATIGTYACLP